MCIVCVASKVIKKFFFTFVVVVVVFYHFALLCIHSFYLHFKWNDRHILLGTCTTLWWCVVTLHELSFTFRSTSSENIVLRATETHPHNRPNNKTKTYNEHCSSNNNETLATSSFRTLTACDKKIIKFMHTKLPRTGETVRSHECHANQQAYLILYMVRCKWYRCNNLCVCVDLCLYSTKTVLKLFNFFFSLTVSPLVGGVQKKKFFFVE